MMCLFLFYDRMPLPIKESVLLCLSVDAFRSKIAMDFSHSVLLICVELLLDFDFVLQSCGCSFQPPCTCMLKADLQHSPSALSCECNFRKEEIPMERDERIFDILKHYWVFVPVLMGCKVPPSNFQLPFRLQYYQCSFLNKTLEQAGCSFTRLKKKSPLFIQYF